ncbi:MAG TPA: riboflavin synthase [Beijerinckiaceae bacterium]|nr:riboflavin synthase [Beijerinckiaceae bacterium]
MFTGIVEKTVRVIGAVAGPKFRRLTLAADWPDVRDGESVAVNGVCLTIAARSPGELAFDVVKETLDKTNLGQLQSGDEVHVERSLRVGDRIDGHFVQGHADGVAMLVQQVADENEWRLTLEPPRDLMKFVVPKGSVTLDGVSLTVAAVGPATFDVALIPTTVNVTALARRPLGWRYNFEADVLSKTVVSWLERQKP